MIVLLKMGTASKNFGGNCVKAIDTFSICALGINFLLGDKSGGLGAFETRWNFLKFWNDGALCPP